MDPSDNQDSGAAEGGDAEAPSRAKGPGRTPGSLMSLKIRKRVTVTTGQLTPPPSARTEAHSTDPATISSGKNTGKTRATADAIDRVTRRAQSAQAKRAPEPRHVPAPRPSVTRPPAAQAPESDPGPTPSRNNDIVAYWTRLRASRRFPMSSEIDAATVSECWPNSILIRCRPGSQALEPEKVFIAGEAVTPGLSGLRGRGRANLSPMMLQWILSLAGAVVRESRPMNDVETFPAVKRVVHYRAVALPFSDNDSAVDHVLCHFQAEN